MTKSTRTTSIANLEKSLAEAQAIQAELSAKAAASTDRVTALDAELTALRGELAQTKDTLDSESSRAKKATSKWEADRQSLERAKDALAVVLAQIEDTEARTL